MQVERTRWKQTAEAGRQIGRAALIHPHAAAFAPLHPILQLQQTKGNQAVQRLLRLRTIQAKLAISQPGDIYEQEADQVAEQVMRMPESVIQRTCSASAPGGSLCSECEWKQKALVQRKADGRSDKAGSVADDFVRNLGPGAPLNSATRAYFEPRFGRDFSRVRVHADTKAAESTRAVDALAYTVGPDIVFAQEQYRPATENGRRLLAHELTHVVQQEGGGTESVQRKEEESPAKSPCGGTSLASKVGPSAKRLGGGAAPVELGDNSFGNTSKLGADFRFGACKVDKNWRFYLDALVVPIASRVQPDTFRLNVPSAADPIVKKESYPDIVKDLSPTAAVTFSVSCGGNKFEDKVTTYSRRKEYWNYQFVVEHEAFHRKNWMETYRKELINAESNIWAHSVPVSGVSDAAAAIAKANDALTKYMTDAYQNTCKAYGPKQESRAYDDGAPQYQKLVDEIRTRAEKEKWK